MGTGLPDRETGADEAELSFDKALYNWLIDMCEAEKLGVRRDETQECAKFHTRCKSSMVAREASNTHVYPRASRLTRWVRGQSSVPRSQ